MIPKSIAHKLVRKSDGVVVAEGNRKDMQKLKEKTPETELWLSDNRPMLGETVESRESTLSPRMARRQYAHFGPNENIALVKGLSDD